MCHQTLIEWQVLRTYRRATPITRSIYCLRYEMDESNLLRPDLPPGAGRRSSTFADALADVEFDEAVLPCQ